MSKTDKDRPFWVQNAEHGHIDHDHTSGVCRISDDQRDRWPAWRHHWSTCKKRVVEMYFCTKDAPHTDYRGRATCWKSWRQIYDRDGNLDPRWVSTKCDGRRRVTRDNTIPCSCDHRDEPATCFPSWRVGASFVYGGVPSWYVSATWHRPERRRKRDQLSAARREYNEYGNLEGGDLDNPQARNRAHWTWW